MWPSPSSAAPARVRLFDWLARDLLVTRHALPQCRELVLAEMNRCCGREIDFADVWLVTLSDHYPLLPIVATDAADFAAYLRGRTPRTMLAP